MVKLIFVVEVVISVIFFVKLIFMFLFFGCGFFIKCSSGSMVGD